MFSSWKTTVAGILIAAATLFASGHTPKQIGLALAVSIFGAVSKDFNVSGGAQ